MKEVDTKVKNPKKYWLEVTLIRLLNLILSIYRKTGTYTLFWSSNLRGLLISVQFTFNSFSRMLCWHIYDCFSFNFTEKFVFSMQLFVMYAMLFIHVCHQSGIDSSLNYHMKTHVYWNQWQFEVIFIDKGVYFTVKSDSMVLDNKVSILHKVPKTVSKR